MTFVHREDLEKVRERLDEILAGRLAPLEFRTVTNGGRVHWVRVQAHPFLEAGRVVGVRGVMTDVTESRSAHLALERSRRELAVSNRIAHVFLTAAPEDLNREVLAVVCDALQSPYGLFGFINDNGDLECPALPESMHQACNMPPGPMIIPCDPDSTGIIGRALAERRTLFRTGDLRVPLGHVQLRSAIATPIVLKGNLVGAFVMANRPDGYGPDQVRQLERIAAQTAPVLQAKLESERQECQRRELERRLRQAQKMEAIGTLAGGIAHDFNNILSGVLGYAELALDDLADRPRTQNRVQQVIRAALRAQDVVRQILTFSRQTEQTRSPVRLQSVVKEVARLLRSSLPASISLHMSLPPELEPVLADPAQIHQVLMNLATNAYQSMRPLAEAPAEARRDCILRIGLERAEVDAGNPEGHRLGLPPGSYAVLSVRDTGDGIPPHIRDRIFEPYFTTRQKENGTGLGLATVQGIAQAHGGAVTFETRIGEGTAFRVFLPMAAPDAIARDEGTAQARPPHAGCEQILLVDDEHMILEVQQQSLELRGYRALAYGDPVQALDAFTQSPREIDLVVTDLTMPHMNGLELTKQLRQHRPDLPVILCTGFGDATTERTAEQLGIDLLLRKPLLTSELADAIRHALDKRHHRGHDAPS